MELCLGPTLLDLCNPELDPSLLTASVFNLPLTDEGFESQSDPFWIWGEFCIWKSGIQAGLCSSSGPQPKAVRGDSGP